MKWIHHLSRSQDYFFEKLLISLPEDLPVWCYQTKQLRTEQYVIVVFDKQYIESI